MVEVAAVLLVVEVAPIVQEAVLAVHLVMGQLEDRE